MAFKSATSAATMKAAPVLSSAIPGSTQAANQTAAAATIQPTISRSGRSRSCCGCHSTRSLRGRSTVAA